MAQNVPGPVAVARLVAEGATAVKIEPPGGDPLRGLSRRWYRRLHRGVAVETVDLKSAGGRARLDALLASADLLITSQRPSALRRLGISKRSLARRHPGLRWLNIVGDTREPERPGHDLTYQAEAGLLGREMPRALLADLLGAERAVTAALLLLARRPPSTSQVGLRDAVESLAVPLRVGLTARRGALGGGLPGYGIYDARAGRVAVAALEPHFRARLYNELGLEDGADLTAVMRTRTARQWHRWAMARDLPLVALTIEVDA
jgi:crotonobetainyl-CoA:carnitine CoA-transferase CaiB-like acyl-CoA transferase